MWRLHFVVPASFVFVWGLLSLVIVSFGVWTQRAARKHKRLGWLYLAWCAVVLCECVLTALIRLFRFDLSIIRHLTLACLLCFYISRLHQCYVSFVRIGAVFKNTTHSNSQIKVIRKFGLYCFVIVESVALSLMILYLYSRDIFGNNPIGWVGHRTVVSLLVYLLLITLSDLISAVISSYYLTMSLVTMVRVMDESDRLSIRKKRSMSHAKDEVGPQMVSQLAEMLEEESKSVANTSTVLQSIRGKFTAVGATESSQLGSHRSIHHSNQHSHRSRTDSASRNWSLPRTKSMSNPHGRAKKRSRKRRDRKLRDRRDPASFNPSGRRASSIEPGVEMRIKHRGKRGKKSGKRVRQGMNSSSTIGGRSAQARLTGTRARSRTTEGLSLKSDPKKLRPMRHRQERSGEDYELDKKKSGKKKRERRNSEPRKSSAGLPTEKLMEELNEQARRPALESAKSHSRAETDPGTVAKAREMYQPIKSIESPSLLLGPTPLSDISPMNDLTPLSHAESVDEDSLDFAFSGGVHRESTVGVVGGISHRKSKMKNGHHNSHLIPDQVKFKHVSSASLNAILDAVDDEPTEEGSDDLDIDVSGLFDDSSSEEGVSPGSFPDRQITDFREEDTKEIQRQIQQKITHMKSEEEVTVAGSDGRRQLVEQQSDITKHGRHETASGEITPHRISLLNADGVSPFAIPQPSLDRSIVTDTTNESDSQLDLLGSSTRTEKSPPAPPVIMEMVPSSTAGMSPSSEVMRVTSETGELVILVNEDGRPPRSSLHSEQTVAEDSDSEHIIEDTDLSPPMGFSGIPGVRSDDDTPISSSHEASPSADITGKVDIVRFNANTRSVNYSESDDFDHTPQPSAMPIVSINAATTHGSSTSPTDGLDGGVGFFSSLKGFPMKEVLEELNADYDQVTDDEDSKPTAELAYADHLTISGKKPMKEGKKKEEEKKEGADEDEEENELDLPPLPEPVKNPSMVPSQHHPVLEAHVTDEEIRMPPKTRRETNSGSRIKIVSDNELDSETRPTLIDNASHSVSAPVPRAASVSPPPIMTTVSPTIEIPPHSHGSAGSMAVAPAAVVSRERSIPSYASLSSAHQKTPVARRKRSLLFRDNVAPPVFTQPEIAIEYIYIIAKNGILTMFLILASMMFRLVTLIVCMMPMWDVDNPSERRRRVVIAMLMLVSLICVENTINVFVYILSIASWDEVYKRWFRACRSCIEEPLMAGIKDQPTEITVEIPEHPFASRSELSLTAPPTLNPVNTESHASNYSGVSRELAAASLPRMGSDSTTYSGGGAGAGGGSTTTTAVFRPVTKKVSSMVFDEGLVSLEEVSRLEMMKKEILLSQRRNSGSMMSQLRRGSAGSVSRHTGHMGGSSSGMSGVMSAHSSLPLSSIAHEKQNSTSSVTKLTTGNRSTDPFKLDLIRESGASNQNSDDESADGDDDDDDSDTEDSSSETL